jgi:hypothetical protein
MSTVKEIITPGININIGLLSKYVLLSLIIIPHSAIGAVTPNPKKDSS